MEIAQSRVNLRFHCGRQRILISLIARTETASNQGHPIEERGHAGARSSTAKSVADSETKSR